MTKLTILGIAKCLGMCSLGVVSMWLFFLYVSPYIVIVVGVVFIGRSVLQLNNKGHKGHRA